MIDKQAYQWPQAGNETPMIGHKVYSEFAGKHEAIEDDGHYLMMPLYSTVAMWVPFRSIKPYPSEPIPTP